MKYLKYFERKDVEQSQFLLKCAKEIIELFYNNWKESLTWDNNDFEWFLVSVHSVQYKTKKGNYMTITITDDDSKSGSFSAINDDHPIIKIAYPHLYKELNFLYDLLEKRKHSEAKPIIDKLLNNKELHERLIHVLAHELSHYEDFLKYDIFNEKGVDKLYKIKKILNLIYVPDSKPLTTEEQKKVDKLVKKAKELYFNLTSEYNAYFLMFCSEELEKLKNHYETSDEKWLNMNFHEYYKYFQNMIESKGEFNDITKKRLQKRLYQFYQDITMLDDEIFKNKN